MACQVLQRRRRPDQAKKGCLTVVLRVNIGSNCRNAAAGMQGCLDASGVCVTDGEIEEEICREEASGRLPWSSPGSLPENLAVQTLQLGCLHVTVLQPPLDTMAALWQIPVGGVDAPKRRATPVALAPWWLLHRCTTRCNLHARAPYSKPPHQTFGAISRGALHFQLSEADLWEWYTPTLLRLTKQGRLLVCWSCRPRNASTRFGAALDAGSATADG